MALDAKYFGIDIPPDQRGEGAWDRNAASMLSGPSALSAPPLDKVIPTDFENGMRRRRLRRAGSKVAQEGIWEGILGGVTDIQALNTHETTRETEQTEKVPAPIPEANNGFFGTDDIAMNRLFDGMVFYTCGFTERKVVHYKASDDRKTSLQK